LAKHEDLAGWVRRFGVQEAVLDVMPASLLLAGARHRSGADLARFAGRHPCGAGIANAGSR